MAKGSIEALCSAELSVCAVHPTSRLSVLNAGAVGHTQKNDRGQQLTGMEHIARAHQPPAGVRRIQWGAGAAVAPKALALVDTLHASLASDQVTK